MYGGSKTSKTINSSNSSSNKKRDGSVWLRHLLVAWHRNGERRAICTPFWRLCYAYSQNKWYIEGFSAFSFENLRKLCAVCTISASVHLLHEKGGGGGGKIKKLLLGPEEGGARRGEDWGWFERLLLYRLSRLSPSSLHSRLRGPGNTDVVQYVPQIKIPIQSLKRSVHVKVFLKIEFCDSNVLISACASVRSIGLEYIGPVCVCANVACHGENKKKIYLSSWPVPFPPARYLQ